MNINEELFDVPEAAKSLKVKPGTIRLWVSQRRLGAIRVGTRLLKIPRSEIERFIRAGYLAPTSPMAARDEDPPAAGNAE
jgi:excisionase family DNA binding protein